MTKIYRAEAISGALTAAIIILVFALSMTKGLPIDLASFAVPFLTGVGMLLVAGYYRWRGRSPRIGLAIGSCAIFILFSNSGGVLNYALLPTSRPVIDGTLFQIDAALGFDWSRFAGTIADYPTLSDVLGYVYRSSLPQLAFVILLLGFTGQRIALHRFLIVGVFTSCLSIFIWVLAPSFGPSPYVQLDPAIDASLGRVVDAQYGSHLLDLARHGPDLIRASEMIGLIAFPSMHTVMAWMSVWFTRRTVAFWPAIVINVLMIPAIIVHGGHHLIDIIAGSVAFALTLLLARRLIPDDEQRASTVAQSTADTGDRPLNAPGILAPVARLSETQPAAENAPA